MSCTVLLRNKGILFCHFVTGIRKSATKENKVSIENALLYRERKVILHINKKKPRTLPSDSPIVIRNFKNSKQKKMVFFKKKKKKSRVFVVVL